MADLKLKGKKREVFGRKVKKLREKGILPANVFGKNVESKSIEVDLKEFSNVLERAGETSIIELTVGKDKNPVLVHNVQLDPVTDDYIHADFLQVNLKQKVSAQVPVVLIGESPAEKQGLGTVVQYMDEIEVEALPTDLPERFEIDTSELEEVEQEVQVTDLDYNKDKVTINLEEASVVAKVEPPREEEEEEPVVSLEAEDGVEVVEGEEGPTAEDEDLETPTGEESVGQREGQ